MEKKFRYIFKDEFGYFTRHYTLNEIADGKLSEDIKSFLQLGAEIIAGGLCSIGMRDCMGTMIYEDDIIELQLENMDEDEREYWDPWILEIKYSDKIAAYIGERVHTDNKLFMTMEENIIKEYYKVIGNVYES